MLDTQLFTLISNFINANFSCELSSILQGTGGNFHKPINSLPCTEMNSIQKIFTSILSPHEVTFKYTIKYFPSIGGLYICLMRLENISDDGLNSMKAMDFCKLISYENETTGCMPQITFLNTKVKFFI
jgi:hypothetical protein